MKNYRLKFSVFPLFSVLLLAMGFCSVSLLFAKKAAALQMQETSNQVISATVRHDHLVENAKVWGLSPKDFKRYLWLMKNTPSGHWYPNLDPAEVLALNAKDPAQMLQYAKIQARNMHVRVTREWALNRSYNQAYRMLYPNEKPIRLPGLQNQTVAQLQAGDRLWLFIQTNAPLSQFIYHHLMQTIQATPQTMLDIYFVGQAVTRAQIEHWAMSVGIQPQAVNHAVTLNFGNERFQALTKGKPVALPLIGVVHDGHFQAVTLSSVL